MIVDNVAEILQAEVKHRGFAFVTYSSPADAQDAIDNMDLNDLNGRVVRVSLARPMKGPTQGAGNRASELELTKRVFTFLNFVLQFGNRKSGSNNMRNRSPTVEVCGPS